MWASASAETIPMVVERFGFGWPKRTSGLAPSVGAAQLCDDAVRIGGSDERCGFAVVLAEVAVDRGLEVDQRVEDASLQTPTGERGEEGLQEQEAGVK